MSTEKLYLINTRTGAEIEVDIIDKGLKVSNADTNFKGYYATEAALNTAYPTAENGNYAVVGATDTVWLWDGDTNAWVDSGSQGITEKSDAEIQFPAGSFDLPPTNFADWEKETGTNGRLRGYYFDDNGNEEVEGQFVIPNEIDPNGTITIEVYGISKTAAASKNVEFTFYHSSKQAGEQWDSAYSNINSGDKATNSNQGYFDRFTFTASVSSLGWVANDHERVKFGRTLPSANNLVGDYIVTNVKIIIPRA